MQENPFALMNEVIAVEGFSTSGLEISAASTKDFVITCSLSGYKLIGVAGNTIAGVSSCSLVHAFVSGATTITVRVRNNGASAVTPSSIGAFALFVKN